MKKYLYTFIGSLLLLTHGQNTLALSINDFRKDTFKPVNLPGITTNTLNAETKINLFVSFFIDFILYASGSLAVLYLVIGGIRYVVSFGQQDGMDNAKKTIKNALLGLLGVIMAYFVVTNVTRILYEAIG